MSEKNLGMNTFYIPITARSINDCYRKGQIEYDNTGKLLLLRGIDLCQDLNSLKFIFEKNPSTGYEELELIIAKLFNKDAFSKAAKDIKSSHMEGRGIILEGLVSETEQDKIYALSESISDFKNRQILIVNKRNLQELTEPLLICSLCHDRQGNGHFTSYTPKQYKRKVLPFY